MNTHNRLMSLAQVAALVIGHMADHGLPEPATLHLDAHGYRGPEARVQITGGRDLAEVAATLLAWANSFTLAAVRVWLPPTGTAVHLDVDTTLSGPDGQTAVTVYGGVVYDPQVFGPLERDERRPVTLGRLTAWAAAGAEVVR